MASWPISSSFSISRSSSSSSPAGSWPYAGAWPLAHVPAAIWGVFVEVTGRVCPLTPLENSLRRAAGASGYSGGFIEHYLGPAIYPPALSHQVKLVLAGLVVVSNLTAYWFVWRGRRRVRKGAADGREG